MASGVKGPVALVILDGWGISGDSEDNAVTLADTPCLDALQRDYPSARLGASGLDVGLPDGQMGNSEVGHLNIGAGRVVYQDLTRINKSIAEGTFYANTVLAEAMDKVVSAGGKLHLMGLLSDGGVHSHNTQLYALIEMARQKGVRDVCVHCFMDGRDTPPKSGKVFLADLETEMARLGLGRVATVMGRFYAMDRDNRWERVERAYSAMVEGTGLAVGSSAEAIDSAYAQGQTDEFVEPRIIIDSVQVPGTIVDGDGVVFFNFRADRAREITRALTEADFSGFSRPRALDLSAYVCLTEYDATFPLAVAFPSEDLTSLLGEVLSNSGRHQLRIAETEKYAHVTFFFNGGREDAYPGEERVLIPSPKEVATYDQKPEMSAVEVTDEVVRRITSGRYDFIVLNLANPDMVGHTGFLEAAIKAMETVDACVERIAQAIQDAQGVLLLTADHGNCEDMVDASGQPQTAHTANQVPIVLVGSPRGSSQLRDGILADIAPTVLELLDIEIPAEMSGRSLLA